MNLAAVSRALDRVELRAAVVGDYTGQYALGLSVEDGRHVVVLQVPKGAPVAPPLWVDVEGVRLDVHVREGTVPLEVREGPDRPGQDAREEDLPSSGSDSIEERFWRFHRMNPQVYSTLCRFAREWLAQGKKKLGIKMLFERARWELELHAKDEDGFKLNNNYTAFYARLMMKQERDLDGIFNLRRQAVQTSFGPDQLDLESGEHVV